MLLILTVRVVLAGVSSSMGPTVSGNLQDTSTHSTKSMKLTRGPSPDSCALITVLRLMSRKVERQLSGNSQVPQQDIFHKALNEARQTEQNQRELKYWR